MGVSPTASGEQRGSLTYDGAQRLIGWMSGVEVTPLEDVEDAACLSDRGVR
jgi:hypothetical protein